MPAHKPARPLLRLHRQARPGRDADPRIREALENLDDPGLILLDGYDECIMGTVERLGCPRVVCYDRTKIIARLMASEMTRAEAEDYFAHNIEQWLGERTPCFFEPLDLPEVAPSATRPRRKRT